MSSVVVVGSFNVDHAWTCNALPRAGETLTGGYRSGPGGKGFNQAVAAARAGAGTAFICALGDDVGAQLARALAAADGIDLRDARSELPTGTAGIFVDAQGRNSIVIGAGANGTLSAGFIDLQRDPIEGASVLLVQLESPPDAIAHALRRARLHGVSTVLNPAPANASTAPDLLALADLLTPNETEFAALLARHLDERIDADSVAGMDDAELHALCRRLLPDGTVIITLGACGVFVSHGDTNRRGDGHHWYRIAAEPAHVVDTTGAGDAFNGALAASLANAPQAAFAEHIVFANRYAALSTESAGAAISMPRFADVQCDFPERSDRRQRTAIRRASPCRGTRHYNTAMQIGPYTIAPNVVLAPMAGVTDKPFRLLCKRLGAGLAVSEMTTSDPRFWRTSKSLHRMDHVDEPDPVSVQIAGTEPGVMAEAARYNVDHGAQLIDINMGCPAKKVCNAWAGSALMRDEALVARILETVVRAVDVPVTLKIRTGWNADNRNAPAIARVAEQSGIAALAVHGRTRDQQYTGVAEYDTIAAIKSLLSIPVIANGDIDSPQKAAFVLRHTGADAVMIGRAAQGRPWIFGQVSHYLATGEQLPEPTLAEVRDILLGHLEHLHAFYGEPAGVRIARKHLGWYAKDRAENMAFRAVVNRADSAEAQLRLTREYFDALVAGIVPELSAAA